MSDNKMSEKEKKVKAGWYCVVTVFGFLINPALGITIFLFCMADIMFGLFKGRKHEFDMDNPYIDEIESQHKHSLTGEIKIRKWMVYGWKCKNCDKVLWLDKEQMEDLPRSIKYGCKGQKNV